ncbi:hypothetical protein [Bifidobacterium scardovii]|uniref:Uncharacterized protein n=1 Tax=Bifidobacterium scardovii TaxID=158787 RepID=A0A087DGR4_9BIFI|nr:hypothetical protein [Bifidobacterium scardovii]KFI94714.1 hypothetical protein BSCA_0766 [Bifidobacterium scardovii]MDK6349849.1 hypothetical protein [Bifidobacterium scardovii]MDU8982553.1 hypothetical protein [Bifidobacterium scardovii]BAQ32063.1 hypothetical protein BBSC_1983 [Bifidobacterium scardovii JCM 12489 = DSM 13734]
MSIEEACAIVSAAFGFTGFVLGLVAILQTRHANKLSETANRLNEEAGHIAETANVLASQSNQIGRSANQIGEAALRISKDKMIYRWGAQFDTDTLTVCLANECPYKACDVDFFLIRNEHEFVGRSGPKTLAGLEKLPLQSQLFRDYLDESAAEMRMAEEEGMYVDDEARPEFLVDVYVTWTSELGTKQTICFQERFRDGDSIPDIQTIIGR